MNEARILDLSECTEFRQTLEGRAPRLLHGATVLLVALLLSAVGWSIATEADLVVRAPGRVRPSSSPKEVFSTVDARVDGRVVEVAFEEGDAVRAGDVLARLDTRRLDSDIEKLRETVRSAREEITTLERMDELLVREYDAAVLKAQTELAALAEELDRKGREQAAAIRRAEIELQAAQEEEARLRKLVDWGVSPQAELTEAVRRGERAREDLDESRVELARGREEVLRRNLKLLEHEHEVERARLAVERVHKTGELEAAARELAFLESQREQTVLRAPIDGIVTRGELDVGDVVEAGRPLVEISERGGFRFEANVPSHEVGDLRVGMEVRVKLHAYDYQRYGSLTGKVVFISPDSTVVEAAGSREAAVYVVKVELAGTELRQGELHGEVKLGMGGDAEIVTGRESLFRLLLQKIRHTISLG